LIPFLDTSALVKRYVSEKGSDTVRSLFRRGRPAVVRIAYAEVASALGRLWRAGRVAEDAMRVASDGEQLRPEPFEAVDLDLGGLWLQEGAMAAGSTG